MTLTHSLSLSCLELPPCPPPFLPNPIFLSFFLPFFVFVILSVNGNFDVIINCSDFQFTKGEIVCLSLL